MNVIKMFILSHSLIVWGEKAISSVLGLREAFGKYRLTVAESMNSE